MNAKYFLENIWEYAAHDMNHGCWLWTGPASKYGVTKVGRKTIGAHRFSYEAHTGRKIPDGMHIDHKCRVKLCINPAHLDVVTPQENSRRIPIDVTPRGNTHCKNGHPLEGYNAGWHLHSYRGGKIPRRSCRICYNKRMREYRAKMKAQRYADAIR